MAFPYVGKAKIIRAPRNASGALFFVFFNGLMIFLSIIDCRFIKMVYFCGEIKIETN